MKSKSMQQIRFILLLSLCIVPFAGAANRIPQPIDLALVEEPRLVEAIEVAQKSVEKSPEEATAWGQLGHIYLIHGWKVEATQCYRRAVAIDPTEFRWLYFLGRSYCEAHPQEAVDVLVQAISLDSEYTPALIYHAYALRSLGRFGEAKQCLERAKDLDPQNPFAELWLGELALTDKQFETARAHLQRALILNPEQSEAHAAMAQVALALGELEAANRHAKLARKPTTHAQMRDPLWWEVLKAGVTTPLLVERGIQYLQENNFERAVAEFSALISDTQKDPEIWLNYGVALLFAERYSEAIAALESALAILHSDESKKYKNVAEIAHLKVESYYNLGLIYYRTGRTQKAVVACQRAIELEPDFANAYGSLGRVYWEEGRLDEAIVQYKKAIGITPTDLEFHQDLARIYWQKKMYEEAVREYQIVVTNNSSNVEARYRVGLVFLSTGEYDEAVSSFQKVLEINPNHTLAHGALGISYDKLGRRQEAIGEFQTVLRLDSENQNARNMLE